MSPLPGRPKCEVDRSAQRVSHPGWRSMMTVGAAMLALAAQAQSPADFAWRLPLSTASDGAFFRVEVPPSLYEGAVRADLGDVRVFNGEGAAVPLAFLARPAAAREAAAPVALPLFPLRVDRNRRDLGDLTMSVRRDAAGTTVNLATRDGAAVAGERLAGYLVDASALSAPPVVLTLMLPDGANVSTRVRVEGSDDLAAWRVLNGFAPVLAVEFGGRRLALDRVDLAPGPAKYLRITTVGSEPPLEIAGVRGEFAGRMIDPARQFRKVEGVADKASPGRLHFRPRRHVPGRSDRARPARAQYRRARAGLFTPGPEGRMARRGRDGVLSTQASGRQRDDEPAVARRDGTCAILENQR